MRHEPRSVFSRHRAIARTLLQLGILALCLSVGQTSAADTEHPVYVPSDLAPWVDWVLHDHENLSCPRNAKTGKPARCAWVSTLALDVDNDAEFNMTVHAFAPSRIQLPGNGKYRPTGVTVNGSSATVIGDTNPALMLDTGNYNISGKLAWSKRPSALPLPAQTGLIELTVDGKKVARPTRNGASLLLGKRDTGAPRAQRNSLSTDVYRLIRDGYPLLTETTLTLSVAGQPRLVELGRVLLEGFEVTSFESPLPARLNARGNLEIQVEPGRHTIVVRARALGSPIQIAPANASANWPEQEIWGFQPDRNLRLVNLTGAVPIDLSQTSAPFTGENVQGFLLESGSALNLDVQQRGTPTPTPNRFTMARDLWLAFDGSGYVVRDSLQANISHSSRLSAGYKLGRVSVNGNDELINSLDNTPNGGEPGIELQAGSFQIDSISKIDRTEVRSATGWSVNTDSLSATLHLPPGWRLLWATGVDKSPDAWLARWTLWKIFVLVLLGVLAWRFLSRGFAVLLVLTTGLMMHSAPSLAVVWLVAVVLLASYRHIEHEGALRMLRGVSWLWLILAALLAIGEAVTHARQAVHPQLEHGSALQQYGQAYPGGAPTFTAEAEVADSQILEEVMMDKASSRVRSSSAPRIAPPVVRKKYVEGLQVQTGPGQPQWRWNTAGLYWDGPVGAQQQISLTLMPPAVTRTINLFIAILLVGISALMMAPLISRDARTLLPSRLARIAPMLLFATIVLPSAPADAAKPGNPIMPPSPVPAPQEALLQELEQRLLATPDCFPNCASVPQAIVDVADSQLTITLVLHSEELVTLPLPVSNVWTPAAITLNAKPATVASNSAGALELALPAGQHILKMTGSIEQLERFELNVPMNPASIRTQSSEQWSISGIIDGRIARGSIGFDRKVATELKDETLKPAAAKPFVVISRTLRFDQEWTMETVVSRRSPSRGSFSLTVPLLFEEAVLDNAISIENDQARLVFGRSDSQIRWTSRIKPTNQLTLKAPPVATAAARWTLVPSNFWHLDYSGLNPVADGAGVAGPTFLPEEDDTLELKLIQTTPVDGSTLTIERVEHQISVGARQQRHELKLRTLASQGGTLGVSLAQENGSPNELVSVEVNGRQEPISLLDDQTLALPLTPGSTNYAITWLENTPRGMLFKVAETTFDDPVSNVSTTVAMSRDRWVLLLGGPALGPGILYWGLLLVVLMLALLITRIPGLPFTGTDAILLSLGLSLANLPATLLIAVWVIALRFRGNIVGSLQADWSRNLLQLVSAFLSLMTIITLIASVPSALLGTPNMQVEGNGSSAYFYNWFTDQTQGNLPTAWVLSLPLWVYRVIMLVWSLWLAFALIRWVPWAWQQWAKPQMWYSTKSPVNFTSDRSQTVKTDDDA